MLLPRYTTSAGNAGTRPCPGIHDVSMGNLQVLPHEGNRNSPPTLQTPLLRRDIGIHSVLPAAPEIVHPAARAAPGVRQHEALAALAALAPPGLLARVGRPPTAGQLVGGVRRVPGAGVRAVAGWAG